MGIGFRRNVLIKFRGQQFQDIRLWKKEFWAKHDRLEVSFFAPASQGVDAVAGDLCDFVNFHHIWIILEQFVVIKIFAILLGLLRNRLSAFLRFGVSRGLIPIGRWNKSAGIFFVFFYELEEVLAGDGIASRLLTAVLIFDKTAFYIEPRGQLADMADKAYLLHRQRFGQIFQFELVNFHGDSLIKNITDGFKCCIATHKK